MDHHTVVVRVLGVVLLLLFFSCTIAVGANSKQDICETNLLQDRLAQARLAAADSPTAGRPADAGPAGDGSWRDLQTASLFDLLKRDKADSDLQLTLGDQQISVGLTNDRVAGLKIGAKSRRAFSLTAFGGLPTTQVMDKGVVKNLIYGGRLAARPMSSCEIGASFLRDNRQDKADETGADVSLVLGPRLKFSGLSKYKDYEWHDHSYSARLGIGPFLLKPVYQYFYSQDYSDRYETESHLYGFLRDNNEIVSIAGTDLNWKRPGPLQLGLRGRQYDYALRNEKAYYYAGLLSLETTAGNRIGLEMGRMEGQSPETTYSLLGADLYCRNVFGLQGTFYSADALYIDYDTPVHGQDMAFSASLGLGFSFLNGRLETRLSGEYRMDPYFEENLGVLLSIQFQP